MSGNGDEEEGFGGLSEVSADTARELEPWLDEFSAYQTQVLDLLDEIKEHNIKNEHQKSLDKTRVLADSNEGIFQLIAYALFETDDLIPFLEENFSEGYEDTISHIEYIIDNYKVLNPLLRVVYMERFMNRYKPITTYDSSINYSESDQTPLIRYIAKSGGVPAFETQISSSVAMFMATSMIGTVNDSLEWVLGEDMEVASEELDQFKEVSGTLREFVDDYEKLVEKLEATSDG